MPGDEKDSFDADPVQKSLFSDFENLKVSKGKVKNVDGNLAVLDVGNTPLSEEQEIMIIYKDGKVPAPVRAEPVPKPEPTSEPVSEGFRIKYDPDATLTDEEAAHVLGISKPSFYTYIKKLGGRNEEGGVAQQTLIDYATATERRLKEKAPGVFERLNMPDDVKESYNVPRAKRKGRKKKKSIKFDLDGELTPKELARVLGLKLGYQYSIPKSYAQKHRLINKDGKISQRAVVEHILNYSGKVKEKQLERMGYTGSIEELDEMFLPPEEEPKFNPGIKVTKEIFEPCLQEPFLITRKGHIPSEYAKGFYDLFTESFDDEPNVLELLFNAYSDLRISQTELLGIMKGTGFPGNFEELYEFLKKETKDPKLVERPLDDPNVQILYEKGYHPFKLFTRDEVIGTLFSWNGNWVWENMERYGGKYLVKEPSGNYFGITLAYCISLWSHLKLLRTLGYSGNNEHVLGDVEKQMARLNEWREAVS